MLLVPATMSVLGDWNWWAPRRLQRWHARYGITERAARAPDPHRPARGSGGSAFVRYDIPAPLARPGRLGTAVALPAGPTPDASGSRDRPARRRRASRRRDGGRGLHRPTSRTSPTPRGSLAAVGEHFALDDGNEWEWMCTASAPPPAPAEDELVPLASEHLPRSRPCSRRPTRAPTPGPSSSRTSTGSVPAASGRWWRAVREPNIAGHPVLSGITVRDSTAGAGWAWRSRHT